MCSSPELKVSWMTWVTIWVTSCGLSGSLYAPINVKPHYHMYKWWKVEVESATNLPQVAGIFYCT